MQIEISKNEALVLFEFLSRYSETDVLSIEHKAEQQALYNLACAFEKNMTDPFRPDYKRTLELARKKLQNDQQQ